MRERIQDRLTYANVVSSLCLFLLLGGGAYAAKQLPKNSVGTKQLKKDSVNGAKVKADSLTGEDIKLSELGTVPSANVANVATTANFADASRTANFATNAATAENGIEAIARDIPDETVETIFELPPGLIQIQCFTGEPRVRFRNESGSVARVWIHNADSIDVFEGQISDGGVTSNILVDPDHIEMTIRTDNHVEFADIYFRQEATECAISATVMLRDL